MKDRRPRKLKKEMKHRYSKVIAARLGKCAIVAAMNAISVAIINSQPNFAGGPVQSIAEKSLRIASTVLGTAEKVHEIMNSGPKNWREA
jgi:hypothetical protein